MLYDMLNIDIKLHGALQLLISSIAVRYFLSFYFSSIAFSIGFVSFNQQTQSTMMSGFEFAGVELNKYSAASDGCRRLVFVLFSF